MHQRAHRYIMKKLQKSSPRETDERRGIASELDAWTLDIIGFQERSLSPETPFVDISLRQLRARDQVARLRGAPTRLQHDSNVPSVLSGGTLLFLDPHVDYLGHGCAASAAAQAAAPRPVRASGDAATSRGNGSNDALQSAGTAADGDGAQEEGARP